MITIRITRTFSGRWRVSACTRDGSARHDKICSGPYLFVALRLFTRSCHYDSRAIKIEANRAVTK